MSISAMNSSISWKEVAGLIAKPTFAPLDRILLMVVATLLHDIGDDLAPMNHSQYAASILRPYVSEKTHWIIEKHGEFQMFYYAHHLGGDKNKRKKYKDHKYYQDTINFCEKYDQKHLCEAVANDVHAIAMFRINRTFRNLKEFQRAFSCHTGQGMWKEDVCRVYGA